MNFILSCSHLHILNMACSEWATKILVICIIMYFRCEANECKARIGSVGYTIPSGDITLEAGSPLNITCVVENKTFLASVKNPSKYMLFTNNKENISSMFSIVDDRTINLYIPEMVSTETRWYFCNYKLENRSEQPICHNAVFVGTKPKPVTDFSCFSSNLDNLTCTWTPPDNYIKTDYDLVFVLPGRASRNNPSACPKMDTDKVSGRMSCFWSVSTRPHYRQAQPTYNFYMTMNNSLGHNNLTYSFDHYKYVRSGPPENLKGVNATTNSIGLSFKIPNNMITFIAGLKCRILYQCVHGPKVWKEIVEPITLAKSDNSVFFNLTGLEHAYAVCDIRVALRSAKSKDENMWSSNSSITYETGKTVPGAPPKVNIGSFQIDKQYNRSFLNDVYIYWQQIPDSIVNGGDFKYVVQVVGDNRDNVKLVETKMSFAKFENLQNNKDYTFEIWSQNEIGESSEKSYITVPSQSKRPKNIESFTKMARKNGTYELFITPPADSYDVKNITIFWCNNAKDRPYQCTGYLDWIEIPKNSTHFTVPVMDTKSDIWQFAMSVNSENYSSGMVWASCTLLDDQRIGKIKQVYKIGNGRSGSIQLGWNLDCFDSTPNIEGFIIYYCPIVSPKTQNCKEPVRNVTIQGDASTTKGNVTGLRPYTTYRLNVAIKKNTGDIGEESDPVYETTLEGAPSPPVNVTIVENSITNASVSLVWQPPNEMNGALKYYEVHYNNEYKTVNPTPKPEYTLNNLNSFQRYQVYVQACTTACSQPSPKIVFTTKIGTPEQIKQPRIQGQNLSTIIVDWQKPYPPRGPIDYYEVKIRENRVQDTRSPVNYNVTGEKFIINCEEGAELNTLYLSVRAINKASQNYLYGSWSEELECYCSHSKNVFIWVFIIIGCLLMILVAYAMKRAFMCCKVMKNVELKLPPGLAPLPDWGSPKGQEEPEHSPSADEELLLEKMNENRIPSGDSSGCCSGHGSVPSDSGTTISNTSDSGTEQNELRKRAKNTTSGPMRLGVNTQYVTMPTDAANKPRVKPSPGNYCVLGVDPNTQLDPENKYISPVQQGAAKLPYITCDAITPSSPYVTAGDVNKPNNSGYVPITYAEQTEKNPSYVMAGTRNTLMPDSSKKQEENKPIYLQVSDATKSVSDINPWQPQVDNTVPKGYVTVGESLANKRVAESKKGYVPHSRHFDTKLLKED